MAYVRQRGNQLAIVRGVRDTATGKVEQQILMTIYSRAEAREALGPGARRLQALLRQRFPGLRLDWKAIGKAVEERLPILPETYDRASIEPGRFRESLCALTRELGLADPDVSDVGATLVRENADALRFLRDVIDARLGRLDTTPPQPAKDPFGWRRSFECPGIPHDIEELAHDLLERGESARARAALDLLIEAFGEDADANNSLGAIALDAGDVEKACAHFEAAARVGRKAFPRKIAKGLVGADLEKRPYVRALRNLALAQNQAGRSEAALATCDRLEKECGDVLTANAHRAAVGLNAGRFELAREAASFCEGVLPSEGFAAAFAAHELGRREDALASFLRGALSNRRAARLLLGEQVSPTESTDEARDDEDGAAQRRLLEPYLTSESGRTTVLFFRRLKAGPAVAELLSEMEAVVRRWKGDKKRSGWRAAFERMQRMQTIEFAREQTRRILASTSPGDEGA